MRPLWDLPLQPPQTLRPDSARRPHGCGCPRRHRDSRSARLTAARVLTECLPHTRGAGRRQVLLRTSHPLQGRRHSHDSDRLCPPPALSAAPEARTLFLSFTTRRGCALWARETGKFCSHTTTARPLFPKTEPSSPDASETCPPLSPPSRVCPEPSPRRCRLPLARALASPSFESPSQPVPRASTFAF